MMHMFLSYTICLRFQLFFLTSGNGESQKGSLGRKGFELSVLIIHVKQ